MTASTILSTLKGLGFTSALLFYKGGVILIPNLRIGSTASSGLALQVADNTSDFLVLSNRSQGTTTSAPIAITPNPLNFPVNLRVGSPDLFGIGLNDTISSGDALGITVGSGAVTPDSASLTISSGRGISSAALGGTPLDAVPVNFSWAVNVPNYIAAVQSAIGGDLPAGMQVVAQSIIKAQITTPDVGALGGQDAAEMTVTFAGVDYSSVETQGVSAASPVFDQRIPRWTLENTVYAAQPATALAAPVAGTLFVRRTADLTTIANVNRTLTIDVQSAAFLITPFAI